jgi:hypothetical protein
VAPAGGRRGRRRHGQEEEEGQRELSHGDECRRGRRCGSGKRVGERGRGGRGRRRARELSWRVVVMRCEPCLPLLLLLCS